MTATFPGEFEVLRTKAEAGFHDTGELVLTNFLRKLINDYRRREPCRPGLSEDSQ
jgi:uncharacterized protein YehS (DUF1456 family)